MLKINRDTFEEISKHIDITKMVCLKCGKPFGSLKEIVDGEGNTIQIDVSCDRCMKTFVELEISDSKCSCGESCKK